MSALEPGTRIELVSMPDDPDPVPVGTRGTVLEVREGTYPQVHVAWDNGRSLSLVPGVDTWRVIEE